MQGPAASSPCCTSPGPLDLSMFSLLKLCQHYTALPHIVSFSLHPQFCCQTQRPRRPKICYSVYHSSLWLCYLSQSSVAERPLSVYINNASPFMKVIVHKIPSSLCPLHIFSLSPVCLDNGNIPDYSVERAILY